MPVKIAAVIFDMDGVLIDARDWHYESLNKALRLFGTEISRYDHLVTYDGLPTRRKLEMLTLERGLPHELHDFINKMKQVYTMEIAFTHCKPTFMHQYALATLRSQGYRLAVCSNSIRATVQLLMEKSALLPLLDFYLSNEDVSKAKPDPEIYQRAMTRLGLAPEACLIIEDNINGVKAAQASGGHVLRVQDVHEVTLQQIQARIREIEGVA